MVLGLKVQRLSPRCPGNRGEPDVHARSTCIRVAPPRDPPALHGIHADSSPTRPAPPSQPPDLPPSPLRGDADHSRTTLGLAKPQATREYHVRQWSLPSRRWRRDNRLGPLRADNSYRTQVCGRHVMSSFGNSLCGNLRGAELAPSVPWSGPDRPPLLGDRSTWPGRSLSRRMVKAGRQAASRPIPEPDSRMSNGCPLRISTGLPGDRLGSSTCIQKP
jgi:hypothetical protein